MMQSLSEPIRSLSEYEIRLRTLSFDAEPGSELEIVDCWQDGDTIKIRIRQTVGAHGYSASAKAAGPKAASHVAETFTVAQAFCFSADDRFLILSSCRLPRNAQTFVLVSLPAADRLLTLTAAQFQQISARLETITVHDDYENVSDYLGAIEDRTEQIEHFERDIQNSLTSELCFDTEMIAPGTRIAIDRQWHAHGTIFLELRQTNREMPHQFRLAYIADLAGDWYAVLAYPTHITAESDVVPHMVVRLANKEQMIALAPQELDLIRMPLIEELSNSSFILPEKAQRYLGLVRAG